MKNLIILCVLMLFVPDNMLGQNLKALDEKNGFREAIFEMPKNAFKDLLEVESGYYESTNENLSLGDYNLKSIIYYFYKDQLTSIIINIEGYENSQGVLKILQKAYGRGYQSNPYIEKYSWFGKKVMMIYDQNSATDEAIILIASRKLKNLEDSEKEKSASDAAKKL